MKTTTVRLFDNLVQRGFTVQEAAQLRRIEMTLQRWGEAECGDSNEYCSTSIERDEITGKPYRCVYPHNGQMRRFPVPDREAGALKRLAAIMKEHPDFIAYHQTDCRGCNLYIVRKADVREGETVSEVYNRGLAVCD